MQHFNNDHYKSLIFLNSVIFLSCVANEIPSFFLMYSFVISLDCHLLYKDRIRELM